MTDLRERIREACAAADMHASLARLHGATKSQELSLNVYLSCRAWLDAHESVHATADRSADTVRVPRELDVDAIAAIIANRVLHPNEVFMNGPYRSPGEEIRCKKAAEEIAAILAGKGDG